MRKLEQLVPRGTKHCGDEGVLVHRREKGIRGEKKGEGAVTFGGSSLVLLVMKGVTKGKELGERSQDPKKQPKSLGAKTVIQQREVDKTFPKIVYWAETKVPKSYILMKHKKNSHKQRKAQRSVLQENKEARFLGLGAARKKNLSKKRKGSKRNEEKRSYLFLESKQGGKRRTETEKWRQNKIAKV